MKPSPPLVGGPSSDTLRLVPDRFRVTWLAALFGILLGVTMTYVPYEFQTRAFDFIYPQIRLVGLCFVLGSIPIVLAALYPRRWEAVDHVGRIVLIITLGIYWYAVAVTTGSRTGLFLYPLMIGCVAWEGWRSRRPTWLYPAFLGLVSIIFGLIMVLAPSQFSSTTYAQLQPVLLPVGLFYLAGGLGILLAPWRRYEPLRVLLFGGLALPFIYLAYALAVTRSWAGVAIYGVIALGCLLAAWSPWIVLPASVRWRLLRGFVIAGLLPLLVVGGLASFLAQRAIEQETHANTLRAINAEAEWLRQYISDAGESLQTLAASPAMGQAVATDNSVATHTLLTQLQVARPEFGAVGLFDASGQARVVVGRVEELGANLAERIGYADTLDGADVYLSEPGATAGQPNVVIVVPVPSAGQGRGLLAASVPLARLASVASAGSSDFPVRVVDTRAGLIVRDTSASRVLSSSDSLALAQVRDVQTAGITEVSDGTRRYLTAYAPVPGTHWLVLVTQPLSLIYGRITQLSGAVIGLVGVAILLALLLSHWVAREVTDRLSEIQAAAGALAGGDLERRVVVEGEDELADLGRAFNHMAAELQTGQSELARVNSELQAAVQVRDDFISVASHELKTPLTPLKGFGQTLLRQLERVDRPFNRDQASRVVRLMNQQVDRLAELVDDLLDTTRIRGGRFVLDRAPTDLVALTREIVERFQNQSDTEGHTVTFHAPAEPLVGEWDARRLDQVLTNLISNAVRYSPPDTEVQVEVSRDGNSALVAVRDQGIGIPPASLASLFEPFYRAANASENYTGLGLGLYISREIVERHGGHIWAESAGAGQGSQFYVRLPL